MKQPEPDTSDKFGWTIADVVVTKTAPPEPPAATAKQKAAAIVRGMVQDIIDGLRIEVGD